MCLHLYQHVVYFLWMVFHPCLYIYIYMSTTWQLPNWFTMICSVHTNKIRNDFKFELWSYPMWSLWNTQFPSQLRHIHLEPHFSFKTPPYLAMHFKRIAIIWFVVAPISTLSKVNNTWIWHIYISWHTHRHNNPFLFVHCIDLLCTH
jgi:hypothetical protein